jgi:abortive infection bacteriophage resistance protein
VPFSTWSHIFPWFRRRNDKKALGDMFGLQWETLSSWIHAVSHTRNLCAHHSRLWNREFTITPSFANHPAFRVTDNTRFYAQALILSYFMKRIVTKSKWIERVMRLIKSHHYIDPKAMGFPPTVQNIYDYEI